MDDDPQLERLQAAFAGRYRIKGQLGSGGMATVYLAEDLKHKRDLAIKVLKPELAAMLGPERFRQEIDIAARLSHPHIVALIDSGEADSFLYYVMPHIEGDSLRASLNRDTRLPIEQSLRITEQISAALDYAHRQGIVHRDIKPENILLFQGEALLTDFGIALVLQSEAGARLTATGVGIGTAHYMSPEQATGERQLDARSDVYSLACVLYELLAGEPPYTGQSARAILVKSLSDPAPSVRRLRDTVPASVDSALKRAMAKEPSDRFATIAEFASALRASVTKLTNLPVQATQLVGRHREVAEAGAILRAHRLVTLTGPGGTGKTRLALQIAAEVADEFPDGVFWVPLQALRDRALVEVAIKAAVGAESGLIEHVANKRLLILLDNFEQVIDAAPTVSSLLVGTPHSKVLVTSREPLHLDAEHRYPVEPLADQDAAVLFAERARAVSPGFRSTPAVKEICRRLDGLPLAIELAAARVALLDPDDLLARLERRLPLLASHSRDAPARQRTLRATIKWSDELLGAEEQELFRRVAVFGGSFSMTAAEAVCDADIDGLESLVIKSLVRRLSNGRFSMLETVREYALERLEESASSQEIQRRHAVFFLHVAESANLSGGATATGGFRVAIAMKEQDNLRAALAWTLASGAIELGFELASALETLWVMQNPREGMRWFNALFAHPAAGTVAPSSRAHALRAYGSSTDVAGDDAGAEQLYQQSLRLFDELGDASGRAVLLLRLGIQAMRRGELAQARKLVDESQTIHDRNGDRWGQVQTAGTLGAIARDAGDSSRAHELILLSANMARETGGDWWEGGMLSELAMLSLSAGRIDEAEARARDSLTLAEASRDRSGCVFNVGVLATVAAGRGQAELAGRLWGAIEGEQAGAPLGGWRRHRQSCEARIREVAGPDFDRGCVDGRALPLETAVSIAFEAAANRHDSAG